MFGARFGKELFRDGLNCASVWANDKLRVESVAPPKRTLLTLPSRDWDWRATL